MGPDIPQTIVVNSVVVFAPVLAKSSATQLQPVLILPFLPDLIICCLIHYLIE